MTSLILHPSVHHDRKTGHKAADLRTAFLAVVWLAFAAAVPLGAVFVAQASLDTGASAPHASPYIQAKIGNV